MFPLPPPGGDLEVVFRHSFIIILKLFLLPCIPFWIPPFLVLRKSTSHQRESVFIMWSSQSHVVSYHRHTELSGKCFLSDWSFIKKFKGSNVSGVGGGGGGRGGEGGGERPPQLFRFVQNSLVLSRRIKNALIFKTESVGVYAIYYFWDLHYCVAKILFLKFLFQGCLPPTL